MGNLNFIYNHSREIFSIMINLEKNSLSSCLNDFYDKKIFKEV